MGKGVTSKSSQKSAKSSKSSKSTKTPTKTKTIAKGTKFTKTIECYRTAAEYFRDDDKYAKCGFSTKAIHAGNQPDPLHGGVAPSIDLSATYAQPQPGEMSTCFDYLRCGNNTVLSLQRNLASMEGSKYALCFNTGMGAIVTMMSVLQPKDHLLIIDDVYAGCQRYLRKIFIPQTGIAWDMIDFTNLAFVKKAFKKNTKICWIESPTNPTLKCVDIAAIAKMCKERGVLLVIDNTFMSPALQNPIKLGADVVLHSITKYIGGHSDVTGGALCMNCPKLYE
jgi:cystathionine beta-lyase/cystathionine gamma-synthase